MEDQAGPRQTVPSGSTSVDDIVCPSTAICEALGANDSGNDVVLGTTNGGATWTTQTAPSDIAVGLGSGLVCASAVVCEIAGDNLTSSAVAAFGTTNGGATWTPQTLPSGITSVGAMACPSTTVCELGAENSSDQSVILATTNGGSTWTTQSLPSGTGYVGKDIICGSATVCEALAGGTTIVGTTNGGSTWTTQTIPSGTATIGSIACPVTSTCLATSVGTWPTGVVVLSLSAITTTPTATILIPSNGATLSGTTYLDAIAANATSVEFELFGGSYGYSAPVICTATATEYGWLCSWNTTTVPNGNYALVSEATGSGGSTYSSGVSVTINNAPPPSTSVLVPSTGATLSGTAATLDASAVNATSVEFLLFGGSFGYNAPVICTATLTAYGWLCAWKTTTVPDGSYALVSEASGTGGTAYSSGVSVTVRN